MEQAPSQSNLDMCRNSSHYSGFLTNSSHYSDSIYFLDVVVGQSFLDDTGALRLWFYVLFNRALTPV